MAGQLGAFHPAPLPLGACGAYTTAVGARPQGTGTRGPEVGSRDSCPPLGPTYPPFFPPKDPAAPGGPAGRGTGPGPRPGGRSGGPDAARGGLQPGSRAAIARRRYCALGRGGGWDPAGQGCGLTLRPPPPPAASSPPGGGPGSLPGLPAPIGVNGFGPLTPQTNGQPGSDTLYNNGLSPYPGGPSAPPKSPRNGVGSGGGGGEEAATALGRDSSFPAASHNIAPPPCPPAFTVGLAPLSPQPRALAWLTPCSRPTLGCTTTQVSLGATRPGGFEGPQKGIGRFAGGRGGAGVRLSSEESTLLSPDPWAQNDLSKG